MSSLVCADYGYECDFEVKGNDSKVINEFRKHVLKEHGIDYSKDVLIRWILSKSGR